MEKLMILLASLAVAAPAIAGKGHVHGEASLAVVIDSGRLELELELPLDAATGFERAPKSEKEKALLAEAARVLKDAGALWVPTPAAGCTVESVDVGMPDFKGGEHADVDARYVFRCVAVDRLKGVETTLFKRFKRLFRIEARRAGEHGQGAQRLTPNRPALAW